MREQYFELTAPDIRCTLCDTGASIARLRVRDAHGDFIDVALPPESLPAGAPAPGMAGRTIGPCCGRVRGGEALIDGKKYRLTQNEGPNHLHGGLHGCATGRWAVREASSARALFQYELPDGLDGYPGNRALFAEYTVADGALRVVYSATTDAPTWLDMTNHVYWDLSGRFDGSAMDQTLEIAASGVVFNDAAHLPQAILELDDAFDFSMPCALSDKLAAHPEHPQLNNARGFNNAYVLDPERARALGFSARLRSPRSGITMTLTTDQPAIVLYSGGYLGENVRLAVRPGAACPGCAIALEAQGLPDPFHLPGARPALVSPGDGYRREIIWRFEA
ncbi:MAG: galactose mutarotase [Clostridia bacterium]|nr:galactose mutarotase [Clostridia bacterium]